MVFSHYYQPKDTVEDTLYRFLDQSILEDPEYRTYELPDTRAVGHSPIFRNNLSKDGLFHSIHPDLNSVPDVFDLHVQIRSDYPSMSFLKDKDTPYRSYSFKEIKQMALYIGSGIMHISKLAGFTPQQIHDSFEYILTIYAPNRYEWVLTDLAAQYYSIITTALYDTFGPAASRFILNKTQSPIVLTTRDKVDILLKMIEETPEEMSALKFIVSYDRLDRIDDYEVLQAAKKLNVQLLDFDELMELGAANFHSAIKPTLYSRQCICFTSGTSGTPKGVVLTQGNCMATMMQCAAVLYKTKTEGAPLPDDPRGFSMFPLAHVLEKSSVYVSMLLGANIHFPVGKNVQEYALLLPKARPNSIAGVPRVFNKIAATLQGRLDTEKNPEFKYKLVNKAIQYKLREYEKAGKAHQAPHFFYDRLLKKVAQAVGFDDLYCLFSGSAPMAAETINYLRASLNVWNFMNGYGLTETFSGVFISYGSDLLVDNVGACGLTTEVRLLDVPEMGYLWDKNRSGELLIRGPQVSPGYFDEQHTKDSYDADGFFMTGDIVSIKHDGKIRVIDRKKNFFKLSQGEYIAPEKIENNYINSNTDLIFQIWVYGDSTQDWLVGIIGIEPETLEEFLQAHPEFLPPSLKSLDTSNNKQVQQLFADVSFRSKVLERMNAKVANLQGFEKMKNIYVDFEPLNMDNDTLTQSLKVKRHVAKKVFAEQISAMYAEGSLVKRVRL